MSRRLTIIALGALLCSIATVAGAAERDLDFTSADTSLSGTLVVPESHPVAAVVLVHGSGKVERMLPLARQIAATGIAVYTYDKRGTGKSGGDYEGDEADEDNVSSHNIDLLAIDAAGALTLLKQQKELASAELGFVGISQGGWIAPIAAAHSPASFMVLWSGPVSTVGEQLYFSKLAAKESKFAGTHPPQHILDDMRRVPARENDVDPRDSLKPLNIPALWIFGDQDNTIPVALSIERLQQVIRAGHSTFEYRVFAESGHLPTEQDRAGLGYMTQWIRSHAGAQAKH